MVTEHIDELLSVLREQPKNETEKPTYMIHNAGKLESIAWQLYNASFRPNIKTARGKSIAKA